jgi:hypothetical protein
MRHEWAPNVPNVLDIVLGQADQLVMETFQRTLITDLPEEWLIAALAREPIRERLRTRFNLVREEIPVLRKVLAALGIGLIMGPTGLILVFTVQGRPTWVGQR